ncbi:MAG: ABC transporter ATP-binding protein, partial [Clostridia bacterium]|nr:ABC transporter ATP-binding protein [Clostridia bacterium]
NGASGSSVEGITIAVKRGETVGIIGGTGSGKTSLINLIPRLYDATEGEVLIDGRSVKEYRYGALRKKIALVPQKATLFSGTIRDNMRFINKDATDEEIMRAVEIAAATEVVESKGGLDGIIEQGGRNLSGGQRQRLTIARALAANPEILILDDSSSALDYATDAAIRKSMRGLSKETTVFIVSQRAYSIMHADKILVLDDGELVGVGSHEQLLENCEVYREIYSSQYSERSAV